MTDAAGDRLRDYIEARMAERDIPSVAELARRAHVSRDTFQQWWRGRPPQRSTAELVARELGVTYADLIQAREGPQESPATASDGVAGLSALTQALTAQVTSITALLDLFRETADRAEANSAQIRAMEAELQSLRALLGAGAS